MDASGTTAVSAMHAAGASSLDGGAVGEAALELEQSAADLVLHGGLAVLVMNGMDLLTLPKETVTAFSGGGGSCHNLLATGSSAAPAEDGVAAGGGRLAVGACERHVGVGEGGLLKV